MRRPEQAFHIAVARYLDLALPPEYPWTTIGHGGGGKVRGAILKAMGVKPGWPDIIVLGARRVIGLELKAAKGRMSRDQVELHSALMRAGALVYVCRDLTDVESALRDSNILLRATFSPQRKKSVHKIASKA